MSPNSRKTVYVGETHFLVRADGVWLPFPTKPWGVNGLAELLWAPDSSAFVVTESDGGWVGSWLVNVYRIDGDTVAKLDVSQAVTDVFQKRYPCVEPETPNVGAVAWLEGSKRLLLVAEVPPHSSCHEMGKLGGFVVEVPGGRIVQEYSEAELRDKWGKYLGIRLSARLR